MVASSSSAAQQPGDGGTQGEPVGVPLIVLGMHRCGTSALAGALSILGVELGGPLMSPREGENTRGYFEHLEIYRFHQRLLETLGVSWDDLRSPRFEADGDPQFGELREELAGILRRHFAGASLWAVKDPRACRFLPLWRAVLAELGCAPRYLIIFRHPDEVAASLARRDRFSRDKSDLLWADHFLAAEAATRGEQRSFLSYAELLRAPEIELARVAKEVGIEWPAGGGEAMVGELREFLSGRLRHHVASATELAPRGRLGTIVPRLWEVLDAASSSVLDEAACGALRGEFAEVQGSFDPLLVEHFSQLAMRGELRDRVTELERVLAEHTQWMQVQDGELEGQRESLRSLEERLDQHARWLQVQEGDLEGQRKMLWSLEEMLGERTRWLQIQDEILHRQIARIDALEGIRELDGEKRDDDEP